MANLNRSRSAEEKRQRKLRNFDPTIKSTCFGGPWNGQELALSADGDGKTGVVKVGKWKGRYAHTGSGDAHWENVL